MARDTRYAAGIDLGGTTIKYAVVDDRGGILFHGSLPTPATAGAEAVAGEIVRAANECAAHAAKAGIALDGIGIGSPGVISPDGRTVVGGAENIAGWENVPLADIVTAATGLPVRMDNDANLMALAETMFGAARGASDVVFITVGTGIGGGILIGGKLFGGYRNRGTEIGHTVLVAGGERCACGARGCLEHYASTSALVRRFRERKGGGADDADGRRIVELYLAGDADAAETMEEHWRFLSEGIRSLVNIFAPQTVVVGGGISEAGEFYFDKLREYTAAAVMPVCGGHTRIVAAELGNSAGSLGAAGLVFAQNEKA